MSNQASANYDQWGRIGTDLAGTPMSKEELDQALQQRVSQQLSKLESNMERMM